MKKKRVKMEPISVALDPQSIAYLDRVAAEQARSRSQVVRLLVLEKIEQERKGKEECIQST